MRRGFLFSLILCVSKAALYKPDFKGGIGCGARGSIDNNCTAAPTAPYQATNGAGVICYDGAKRCNENCDPKECYPDVASCATGYAGGFVANIWICPHDNALFTTLTAVRALPNGDGSYCFNSEADCRSATNFTGTCSLDLATCSTGQAGPTSYNYIHFLDKPTLSSGIPTGAGILCYDTAANCHNSNSNPCNTDTGAKQCKADVMVCATGQAGPMPATFTCESVYPPGSLCNGAGQYCYNTYANCVGGPNACSDKDPCMLDAATCSTGAAGPTVNNWFCPKDMPANSLPNGGGQLCYATTNDCVNGPNACSDGKTCKLNTATCGTGQVGPTSLNTFCNYDQPNTQEKTPDTPGSLPNAAGGNCYASQSECLNGPNACLTSSECTADFTTCSTGQAGPTSFWHFCAKDFAIGSVADGGGQLCYNNAGNCFNGPNPCNLSTPCAIDFPTCSTGPAGPTPSNYYCSLDTPVGIQTQVPALASGSGMLCWDSITDCIAGPNACTKEAGDCVNNNISIKSCSSGAAAGNFLGNNIACLKDIPTGAVVNAPGKWCYNTMQNCLYGTNACNSSAPCTTTPTTVCATAEKGFTYYCPYDYPIDVTKGMSNLGNLCYKTAYDCMQGPNACNFSYLCQQDPGLTMACRGATNTWYCNLNNAIWTGNSATAYPSILLASSLAGLSLLFTKHSN